MAKPELDPTNGEDVDPPLNEASIPAPEAAVDNSQAQITALQEEVNKARDQSLRALAEAENVRKRALKDREDAGKYAISNFARDMLDFADNFHRALAAIPAELRSDAKIGTVITGIETMEKDIARTFEKHGITKIEPLGAPFDANFHEVMFEVPGTGKPGGTVIQVIEAGYMLKDRLLRPARVGVAKNEGEKSHNIDTMA